MAAQHLDDPHGGAVVADREGVGALQSVLDERVRDEALIGDEIRHPQGLAMLEDPAGEAFAAAGRIRGLLPGEGGGDVLAARPDVPADEILVGRDRPQRRHVPVEAPAQCREDALGRRLVDRGVGEDLEQLARQLRPALELLLVPRADDADDHRPRQRVVEDADDQLGADVGPVGPLDVHVERPSDQVRGLRVHEGAVVVADGRRQRIGHEVEDGAADQGCRGASPADPRPTC